jgi:hypothetical protein
MKTRHVFIPLAIIILIMLPACGSKAAAPAAIPPTRPPVQATSQPVASATALPTATLTVLPTATEPPAGPCDNLLFPLVPGRQWIYQVTGTSGGQPKKIGLTVDKVEASKATIDALDMSSGVITQTVAECDNGAILNFPSLTQMMLVGNAASSDFTVKYVSGVFAPAQANFKDNNWAYQWTTDLTATGTIQVQDEGTQTQIVMKDSPLHIDWKTSGSGDAAFESVTVQAGTFPKALKVQRQVQSDVSLVANGTPVKGKIVLQTTQWYEPSTGLLKSQVDSGNIVYMGMTFPIQLKNTLELVEFRTE